MGDRARYHDGTRHGGDTRGAGSVTRVAFGRDGRRTGIRGEAGRRQRRGHRVRQRARPDLLPATSRATWASSRPLRRRARERLASARARARARTSGPGRRSGDRTINTRWFWNWPTILDNGRSGDQGREGGVLGTIATDHFYPMARIAGTRDRTAAPRSSACSRRSVWTASTTRSTRTPPRRRTAACCTGWTRRTPRRAAAPPGVSDTAASADVDTRHAVQRRLPAAAGPAWGQPRLPCGRHGRQRPRRGGQPVLQHPRRATPTTTRSATTPRPRREARRRGRPTTRCCCSGGSRRGRRTSARVGTGGGGR